VDAEWVNRGGILAEAVSFLLIAPEIIGIERLRGFESRLETLLRGVGDQPVVARRTGLFPFQLYRFTPRPLELLRLVTGWVALMAVLVVPTTLIGGAFPIVFLVVLALGGAASILDPWLEKLDRPRRGVMWVRHLLRIAAAPVFAVGFGTSMVASFAVIGAVRGAARLLTGSDRLRALVFGSGVVLLFGGMAAQFVSTF
jgi:hypothetical protein